jgi:hypothetical protein
MDPVTTTPLVDTKLFVPRARQRLVPRPRLDLLGRTAHFAWAAVVCGRIALMDKGAGASRWLLSR